LGKKTSIKDIFDFSQFSHHYFANIVVFDAEKAPEGGREGRKLEYKDKTDETKSD